MRARRGSGRCGLTVVEVMVALVIIGVGLLGMAGTASLSLRTATTSARELLALRALERRLALTSASTCESVSSGEDPPGSDAPRVGWQLAAPSRGVRLIDARVQWHEGPRLRMLRFRSALLC